MGTWRSLGLAAAAAATFVPAPASAQRPAYVDRAWVQATASGRELRATAASGECPAASVDAAARPMTLRAPLEAGFPAVCALPLESSAKAITVGGREIGLRPIHPKRLVILGDTGCRIKGKTIQACDDPKAWPWRRVAALAAARRPDLIVHVGDYLYRESACPQGDARCAGTPHGDVWPAWDADFFEPAGPLLTAAPWVFARGNHEDCARAGKGWFKLLDAAPQPPACPAGSAPFAVDLGGLSLVILDSADTADREIQNADAFRADFEAGLKLAPPGQVWVVTHRPVWGEAAVAKLGPVGPIDVALNLSEQAALKGEDLSRVDLMVAGHVHEFESLSFGSKRPPQLVVGTGGDVTEDGATPRIVRKEVEIDGLSAELLQFARFGYLMLDRTPQGWSGGFYDAEDRLTARCRVEGRKLECRPVGRGRRP